jgi:hypothetical protein
MKKEFMNFLLFVGICFLLYVMFRNLNFSNRKDGMTNMNENSTGSGSSVSNGIAGNAAAYGATIKAATIKSQDMLLINKYRSEYESSILNLEDFINNLMLKTALTIDQNNPGPSLETLATMQQAKVALDGIMKFVDNSK